MPTNLGFKSSFIIFGWTQMALLSWKKSLQCWETDKFYKNCPFLSLYPHTAYFVKVKPGYRSTKFLTLKQTCSLKHFNNCSAVSQSYLFVWHTLHHLLTVPGFLFLSCFMKFSGYLFCLWHGLLNEMVTIKNIFVGLLKYKGL